MSTKKKAAAKKAAPAKRTITIGMYNVGFGDAFLVRIPDGAGERRILFDCGMHMGGPGPTPISEVAKRIVADVTDNGKARIDVVVGTHRHADHVSGFQQTIWSKVAVSEVWLPWSEDPNDAHAQKILESQSKRSLALMKHITARARKDKDFRAAAAKSGLMEIAENNLRNAPAMKTLHEGFAGGTAKRFFLPSNNNERPRSFTTDVLPGVKVHVLGPSKDDAVIANLVKEEEKLFRISQSESSDTGEPPFKPRWVKPTAEINTDPALEQLRLDAKTLKNIEDIGDGSELAAAASTDNQINNTSLMLLFEIGNAVLLFPGDAQWGTWQAALNDPEWQPLLKKVTFLKVGHHGSENATPKTFVAKYLGDKYLALVSTIQTKMWAHVPKPTLITRVAGPKADRLARSDKPTEAPAAFTTEGTIYTEVKIEF
jgi:Predicted hydrolase (metallo-beta-lactamase superfamily)